MKKVFASLFTICLLAQTSLAQDDLIRPPAIGVSFALNDFHTPQRIRNGSLEQVFREDSWAKFREMAPGLAITYFRGLKKHIDFAGTLAASYVNYSLPNKNPFPGDALLLEADASVQFKMFSEAYWVSPYLTAGIGASKYRNYYGAFIPLGAGVKVNFFNEANLFFTTTYRVPVSVETSSYHFMYAIGVAGNIGKSR